MRKIVSSIALCLTLGFVVPALAGTITLNGTADSMNHFFYSFSASAGDVSVTADFFPQRNKGYTLILTRDGNIICRTDAAFSSWSHPILSATQLTCADPSGPGGTYVAEFYPTKGGSVDFALTVSTP